MSRDKTPAEELTATLAETLTFAREGFLNAGSPQDVADAIDALVRKRIEQATSVVIRVIRGEVQNAALGRDALIVPPPDLRAELRKVWGQS